MTDLELKYNHIQGKDSLSPIVYFIHGRAGQLGVMSIFKNVVPKDWHIVQVQAPLQDPIGGYSWWIKDDPNREAQMYANSEVLYHFMHDVERHLELSPSKRVAFGFSQGGAMLSLLVQEHPDLLDKLALIASFVLDKARITSGSLSLDVFAAHGTADDVVSYEQSINSLKLLEERGASITKVADECGHKIGKQGMKALKTWISA